MAFPGGQSGANQGAGLNENPQYVEKLPPKPYSSEVLDAFSANLKKAGGDAADGLVSTPPEKVKPLNTRLFVKFGKTPQEFLKVSAEVSAKPFEHFVARLCSRFNIPQDKILNDPVLKSVYIQLKNFEMNFGNRLKNKKQYLKLCDKFDFIVAGYVREKKEGSKDDADVQDVKSFRLWYMKGLKDSDYMETICKSAVDPKLNPEKQLLYKKYLEDVAANDEKLEKGEITQEEHDKINDELNEKIANDSGDENVKKKHKKYKENLAPIGPVIETKVVSLPLQSSDKPVTDKAQIKQAMADIQSDSFRLDLHDDGASVIVGPEKYPMEIHVFKNEQTNKFVFFVADHYAEGGVVRVESDNLSEALDGRYLDSYISEKIGAVSDENDSPNKVPDNMLVQLGQRLLGNGKSRGYKIEGENREVLDMMIKVLEQPSVKYQDYYKKVEALNIFFQKEENVAGLRKKLLAGEKPSVDKLLGE